MTLLLKLAFTNNLMIVGTAKGKEGKMSGGKMAPVKGIRGRGRGRGRGTRKKIIVPSFIDAINKQKKRR